MPVSGGLAQDARGAIAGHGVDDMRQLVEIIDTLDGPINVYDDGTEEFFSVSRDGGSDPPTVEASDEADQKGC